MNNSIILDKNNIEKFNDQELIKFLENLILNKKSGKYDNENMFVIYDKILCYGVLKYEILELLIKYPNQQVRLNSLALLAESKKSTQSFTKEELQLIVKFLEFNIGERMEFLPFIKKILKRINDSYVFQKRFLKTLEKSMEFEKQNHTCITSLSATLRHLNQNKDSTLHTLQGSKEFCDQLQYFLKTSIKIGAVNSQNRSCLQIVSFMQEILNSELFPELSLEFQLIIYDFMLLDTYDTNKEMCFKILKQVNSVKPYLKQEGHIVRFCLDLANNIRPIDSITASYILKLVMLSPNFSKTMNDFYDAPEYKIVAENSTLKLVMLLMQRLEEHVQVAEKSIIVAASKHSLYGLLFCVRNVLSTINLRKVSTEKTWRTAISKIIDTGFRLSKVVSQIVNNSSPEGHLPMNLNSEDWAGAPLEENNILITSHIVLLCSWRTIKEISLLFGEITRNGPMFDQQSNDGLITDAQIEKVGEYFVTLLCETKHRGAFEQAHVGFQMLCTRLWRLQEHALQDLPKIWLQKLIMDVIQLTNENNKLCATRRSAGVPFMVQAILTSEIDRKKKTSNLLFHRVMRILIGLSQFENSETLLNGLNYLFYDNKLFSQNETLMWKDMKTVNVMEIKTHALNILRALFRNCQLGDLVKDYIADGLISAITSINGKCWAERNAATLLLSALIIRIFGVQRTKDHVNLTVHNRMTGKIFFDRYPKLLEFMLSELHFFVNENCISIKPGVQSILLILSRLYPTQDLGDNDSEWKINEFIDLTSRCAESRVYKTRELAARALVPLLTKKNVNNRLSKLFSVVITKLYSYNAAHGYMLQVLEIMKNYQLLSLKIPQKEFKSLLEYANCVVFNNLESNNDKVACFPLATVFLQTFEEILKHESEKWFLQENSMRCILERIKKHLVHQIHLKDRPGCQIYEIAAINFFISASKNDCNGKKLRTIHFWQSIFENGSVELQKEGWSKLAEMLEMEKDISLFMNEDFITNVAMRINTQDSELESVIYDFLYIILCYMKKNNIKNNVISYKLLSWLIEKVDKKRYCKLGSFFKILGKVYGFASQDIKDQLVKKDANFKKDVYSVFVHSSWMGSSNLECRLEISKILPELIVESTVLEDIGLQFYWWTTLLNLLVDDDVTVRNNAGLIVSNIEPKGQLLCNDVMLHEFFDKFYNKICLRQPEVGIICLFSWAVGSVHDADFESDESDVFLASHNYIYLDPMKLSNYCLTYVKKIGEIQSVHNFSYRKIWEKYKKHLFLPFMTFYDLFYQYENYSMITNDLESILDPSYNEKLLRWRIYENFRSLENSNAT